MGTTRITFAECRAIAPVMPGDEGSNYCDRMAGHSGPHGCMPSEVPYACRKHDSYRRVWI